MKNTDLERIIHEAIEASLHSGILREVSPAIEKVAERAAQHAVQESVRASIVTTLVGLGFNADHPADAQADMVFLRSLREGSTHMRRYCAHAAISTLVASGLWLLWSAVRNVLR